MKKLLAIAPLVFAGGCAYSVHQYGAIDFTGMKPGKRVTVEGSQQYILIKTNNDFVDKAYANLISQCKGGTVTGITSQYRTDLSFLSFTERLIIEGTCVSSQ